MIPEETPPKVTKQMWCQFQPNQIKHNSKECGQKLVGAAHQVSDSSPNSWCTQLLTNLIKTIIPLDLSEN